MKSLSTILGFLYISLTGEAGENFINSDALIVLDGNTQAARQVLIRDEGANRLFEALSSQGKKEIKTESDITITGDKMTCVKYLSLNGDDSIVKILCAIAVK